MKTVTKYTALFTLTLSSALAEFTIFFEGGALFKDFDFNPVDDGSLVIAVTTTSSFSGPISGSFISGDETLLGSWSTSSSVLGEPGGFEVALPGLELTTGITTGSPIAILWFPTLTSLASTPVVGTQYGSYTDLSWTVPSDGDTVFYGVESQSIGGGVSNSLLVANLNVIPEPSSYAVLIGFLSTFFLARRRR